MPKHYADPKKTKPADFFDYTPPPKPEIHKADGALKSSRTTDQETSDH